jgi:hypothetical protein
VFLLCKNWQEVVSAARGGADRKIIRHRSIQQPCCNFIGILTFSVDHFCLLSYSAFVWPTSVIFG